MPDTAYKTYPALFSSKGINARTVSDRLPDGTYMNMLNVEELAEVSLASRLGTKIINRTGNAVNALPTAVHSLGRLVSLNGQSWRYAGAGSVLYRRFSDTQGPYTPFAASLSGDAWSYAVYRPDLSSYPYAFFADGLQMLKDNGSFANPQQWGITPPNTPVQNVTVQAPETVLIDPLDGTTTPTAANVISVNNPFPATTTLTSAVGVGLGTVTPASMFLGGTVNIAPYQFLTVGSEQVLVMSVTDTTFTALFTVAHASGETITGSYYSVSIAASTTATITRSVAVNLGVFPNGTRVQEADYIGIGIIPEFPNDIQSINLLIDVGDGSFTSDYFLASFEPNIFQGVISGTETASEAATANVFASAIGITTAGIGNPSFLDTGVNVWNRFLVQLSDFTGVGRADFNDPTYNWSNANGYQIQIITNTNGNSEVGVSSLFMMGGYGPDSFAGVGYDWLYTYYNENTGAESNPCIAMTDVVPLTGSAYVPSRYPFPRRQPVLLKLVPSTDTQVTKIRIYRRGGTLESNYFRVDEIPAASTSYLDIAADADIEEADNVSFLNDVPVTSTLPIPVNASLTADLTPAGNGQFMAVSVDSVSQISVNQQVTIGSISDPNQEIVIVISVSTFSFFAFVQNPHLSGDPVQAEARYGQPCNICAVAYNAMWLAGDPNNPHYLYYSQNFSPEYFGSPQFVEVGTPDDPITAIVPFQGSLYVATVQKWYTIAPGTQGGTPTVYPTSAEHGCVAVHGFVATESEIWHQAVDGIRTFAGGSSVYRSLDIEFLFNLQEGSTPIIRADPTQLASTVMAYYDNIVFIGYTGTDGNRHRIEYDTRYSRWRNDFVGANCMLLEADTNTLLYGDALGLVHQDRIGTIDETNNGGVLNNSAISINMQTGYQDQGMPKNLKCYQELTLDVDTGGQTLTLELLFDDGTATALIGNVSTVGRQKVNFNINAGLGQTNYRVALQVTGNLTVRATLYQVDIRAIPLAESRKSMDTYFLRFGTDESKILKNAYIEYNALAAITFQCYYDQQTTPGFSFTLPASAQRISTRVRFPAVKFRIFRMVATSTADFSVWPETKMDVKAVVSGKGWMSMQLQP